LSYASFVHLSSVARSALPFTVWIPIRPDKGPANMSTMHDPPVALAAFMEVPVLIAVLPITIVMLKPTLSIMAMVRE